MSFISKRALAFQSSGIRQIFDKAANLKNPVNFSIGQPDFGVTSKVKEATIRAINEGKSSYSVTQGILPLRQKISENFQKENNINTSPDNILVTSGTSAGVFLALSAILDPEDEVIIPDPYFVEYPELVKFLGGKAIFLDTYPNFQISPQALEELVSGKTKAIILNSPNNPTGAVYPETTLRKVAEIARKNNLIILSDEIYEKFVYDDNPHFSIGSIYDNTITLNGLSKSGGMPGWRLAWAIGPKEILDKMKELQQYTIVCAPTLVQYGALEAFEERREIIEEYKKRRDLIYSLLSTKFKIIKPEGAFYIMVEVGDGDKFTDWSIANNVLVVPGKFFSGKNTHIRISYATSLETIKKGCEILLKYPS